MSDIRYVSTREELKKAIEDHPDYIAITDKRLAKEVNIVMMATEAALGVAIMTATTAVAMSWNPIGWGLGVFAITASGALIGAVVFLIVVLGAAILWALWKGWKITAKGKIIIGGIPVEAEIILEPNNG